MYILLMANPILANYVIDNRWINKIHLLIIQPTNLLLILPLCFLTNSSTSPRITILEI